MAERTLTVGARVRTTIDVGGIIRPFVQAGEPGVVEALLDEGGYVVRFAAHDLSMGVHADEIALERTARD